MDTVALLKELSEAFGPPGFEDEVRALLRARVGGLAEEVRVDALGNLIALRRGRSAKVLMLDAHMDEVGFMVSHIEPEGFLRLAPLGGWDERLLPAQTLQIHTRSGERRRGVIGSVPPHLLGPQDREKPIKFESLFVDVGARSEAEVAELGIGVGDPAVIHATCEPVGDHTLIGKAFDDRAGCAVAVAVLEALQARELPWTLAVNFAVREEVGLRGARTAAFQLEPELALALEGTIAADVPGMPGARCPTRLGQGPALSVADRSLVVPRELVIALEELARAHEVPFQYKTPLYGSTDAGAIHETRAGVRAGVVSVPCRYIHAPLAVLRLADLEATVRLVMAFVLEGPERLG